MAYQQSYMLSLGPDNLAVLSLQHQPCYNPSTLSIRHHYHIHKWSLDERVRPYFIIIELRGISCLGIVMIDHALATAVVE